MVILSSATENPGDPESPATLIVVSGIAMKSIDICVSTVTFVPESLARTSNSIFFVLLCPVAVMAVTPMPWMVSAPIAMPVKLS